MAISAVVKNGEIVYTGNEATTAKKEEDKINNTMDKDAFLQLLVAQMKNQDPLEPTSNTEYISQFAQFSSLEQMQNVSKSVDLDRANSLVGKTVMVKAPTTTGGTTFITGKVDFVVTEGNEAYLSIKGGSYPLSDLDTVLDGDYYEAYLMMNDFLEKMNQLPTVAMLTIDYEKNITELREMYDGMNDYQKTFISDAFVKLLESYEEKMHELKLGEEAGKGEPGTEEPGKEDGENKE